MTRSTAAVLAAAAAVFTGAGPAVSAAGGSAVRAEVTVAGERHVVDVASVRVVAGLDAGASYRLPTVGVRNDRAVRTSYRLVVSYREAQPERRPPRHWLRFTPPAVAVDPGRSRAVGVRLDVPKSAARGEYAAVLGVRPGGSEGARLTFRIERDESVRAWLRPAARVAMWLAAALAGAVLAVVFVRVL